MKNGSKQSLKEKPVVAIRRKAGTRSSPSSLAQPTPRVSAPITKTEGSATAPPPPTEPQQPVPLQTPAASAIADTSPSKREQEKQARRELLEVLRDRWPQAFPLDAQRVRPLALGIRQDIAVHLPQQPLERIGAAIGLFQRVTGPAYYRAILRGGPRYGLDGTPRGEVTPAEQALAQRDLQAFYERRKERQQRLGEGKAGDSPQT